MKIMVAGGAGYVGSVLVPKLLEHGHEVHVVDLCWFGCHLPEVATVHREDIWSLTEENLKGFDRVIFLGGLSNDPMAELSPALNFRENAAQPAYLAYIAKRAGVPRMVYASSCSVYGYTENETYDEESPTVCDYPYGISKLQGEKACLQLQDDTFSVIALRQGTVCGYSPRMRFDLIINVMYKFAVLNGMITVNNPAIWRPIVDIRDVTDAFMVASNAPMGISGVFNVAKDNYTVEEIGALMKEHVEALTGRSIEIVTKNIEDLRNYKVNFDKAKNILGFVAQHDVPDMIRSVHEHRDTYGDFTDPRFYNIQTFERIMDQP